MTRNELRQIAVRLLYSEEYLARDTREMLDEFFGDEHYSTLSQEDELYSSTPSAEEREYIIRLIDGVKGNLPFIDAYISKYSETRRIERISKTALSVLRCALCEMLYLEDIPVSVSINEAVEISKTFDSKDTVSFINGVLGSVSRELENTDISD